MWAEDELDEELVDRALLCARLSWVIAICSIFLASDLPMVTSSLHIFSILPLLFRIPYMFGTGSCAAICPHKYLSISC